MNDNSKILLAFLAGAAAGAIAGILLAPEKGSDVRKKMKDKFDDLSKKAAEAMEDFGSKVYKEAMGSNDSNGSKN